MGRTFRKYTTITIERSKGRFEEAEPLYRQALAIDRKVFGNEATEVATDLNNLGALLIRQVSWRIQCKVLRATRVAYWVFQG